MSNVLYAQRSEVLALGKQGLLKIELEDMDRDPFTIVSGTFDLIAKDGKTPATKIIDGKALNVLVNDKSVEGVILAGEATPAGEYMAHYDLVLASNEEQVVIQKVFIVDTEAKVSVP